jgi:hypothetical protein
MPGSHDHHGAGGDDACPWPRADLSGHVEALLGATAVPEMGEAARRLRSDAARVVRLLTRTQPLAGLKPALSSTDPVERQEELAGLAVGLTNAVDYLLNLLDSSASASSPFVLADDTGWSLEGSRADGARDRLTRLRLDARGAAVRQGMRLLGSIACESRQPGEYRGPCAACMTSR